MSIQSWVLGDSGHDRGDQRLDPDDVHDPCQVIGQDPECHFSGYSWKRFAQGCVAPTRGFHRAERMFGLPPLLHGLGVVVEAPLQLFQNVLMLPARNPPSLPVV